MLFFIMKLASLLSAVVLLGSGVVLCSDESSNESDSAASVPDNSLALYYSTMMNFRPCEHGCRCTDLILPQNTNCTNKELSSEVITLINAAEVDPTRRCGNRFKVECMVSLSLIFQQPYSWDLECLDDLLLSVPSNTTDIVISNFRPLRMSCGHKFYDYLHFRWQLSEKSNPIELLTLTIDSSEIRDFSGGAFSRNVFGSLMSIHIKNNELLSFDEVQLQTRIFRHLPSLEIISLVNNTNIEVVLTDTFSHLPQLEKINLTRNSIKSIKQRAFGSRIRSVIYPGNASSIKITELGAAGSLPHLTILDLSHNSLQSLPGQDILELSNASLRYLYLEGNPWNCSCETMAWILELNTSILVGSPGVCHHPPVLRGTPLQQLNPNDFKHCFPESIFSVANIVTMVIIFVVTAHLFNQLCNRHRSKMSIGQIEFDTKDILGPNTFKGKMKDGRPIAVKRYSMVDTMHSSELKILLFLSESGLYHANVIRYLVKEETNTALYIALELCKGSLQDLLQGAIREKNNEVLQQLASRECLRQIAKGVCHLHNSGIEHRDLKPANILWGFDSLGNMRLLLSNFDLGHFTGEPLICQHIRYRTKGWTAPELWSEDSGEPTAAVDIFSLGCVFFYMVTRGAHPFGSLEDTDLLQKNIMTDQFSLHSLVDHQGELKELAKIKDLIESMVQHKADKRPIISDILKHPLLWDSKQQLRYKYMVIVGQIEFDTRESLGYNVYRGKLRNGRSVAVKKVPHLSIEKYKELDFLLHLSAHTNVIQYLWKEDDGETLYMAFELGEANLRDLIQAESMVHITLSTIKDCLHQITKGVCHLHECGIEHRDIKPTNILWTLGKSGKRRFFVSDFDLSHFCDDPSSNKSHYGTEGWSAPELWGRDRGKRKTAVDIFSLGCVYFYVLTSGGHPFGMLNNTEELQNSIMRNQVSVHVDGALSEKFGNYEAELAKDLIVLMIQIDISRRPTACETLNHLFFWTPEKVANFYSQVGNRLEMKQNSAFFVEKLEHNSDEVIQGNWRERLDKVVRTDVKDRDKSEVNALLRIVRNKLMHYKKFRPELKAAYDSKGGVVAYYNYHFPKLLLHTHSACMQVRDQLPSQLRDSM